VYIAVLPFWPAFIKESLLTHSLFIFLVGFILVPAHVLLEVNIDSDSHPAHGEEEEDKFDRVAEAQSAPKPAEGAQPTVDLFVLFAFPL